MRLVNKLLFKLTANRPVRLIELDAGPYLERYYLGQIGPSTFYLHRFVSADRERHLHNHPWTWGRALVLSGGYSEEVVDDITAAAPTGCVLRTRWIAWFNRVDGNHFHRIAAAKPGTWTLFVHGPRAVVPGGMASKLKGWGFLEPLAGQVVFRPFASGKSQWWLDAPLGRDSDREPLL